MYTSISASKVCYNDIGCFSNAFPHINALGKLPLSPDHIGTLFHSHTRQSPTKSINIKLYSIVHVFHGEENDNWISQMTSALLKEVVFM